jgi:hypothetical protein
VRANTKSRVFYAKAYVEGESDGAVPTCFSNDGITPDSYVGEPQSRSCQGCPQNVWGVRDGKGTACSTNTRLAVVDPDHPNEPMLLRVPPASRTAFAAAVKAGDDRGYDYNMMVLKVSFDKEAASPKLLFRPVGMLGDEAYATVAALFEDKTVHDIVGVASAAAPEAAPEMDMSELDAAIAAKKAVAQAKEAKPAPKPAAKVEEADDMMMGFDDAVAATPEPKAEAPAKAKPAAKPVAKPVAAPVVKEEASDAEDDLMGDLDALLSSSDD